MQNVNKGHSGTNRKLRGRKVVKRPASGPVRVFTVDRQVWREAIRLAHGSVRRIEIIDNHTVIVHNRPRGLPRTAGYNRV
jgi:hypothetical protein